MGQEHFAGPEYFTEFDPKKFIRDMQILKEDEAAGKNTMDEARAETQAETQARDVDSAPEGDR
ncbi:hypothetical protein CPHO_03875 [Corynebacterium phocae]|uniref:Uncharacterized protein n=1 Tax=Corynebacterium phocae TaxID=161895 RepID=A0A1L7D1Z6_9CORY|nr:hypothetical protein [Corynebacterium phocae]APT92165.1 hypothetical protein CPHO_03875 [Corynebacterium phocae]KAA8725952.1 hypothetical protein F4V58_03420 [Corynebacterium phocae]